MEPLVASRHDDRPRDERPRTLQEATRDFQEGYLRWALEQHDWNVTRTARSLGLSRSHLYNLMKSHGLRRASDPEGRRSNGTGV